MPKNKDQFRKAGIGVGHFLLVSGMLRTRESMAAGGRPKKARRAAQSLTALVLFLSIVAAVAYLVI